MSKEIRVVAGIIWNQSVDRILISKRPEHLHKGGYWEFPGGKIEPQEGEVEALHRELEEELSVAFDAAELFQALTYQYPEKTVSLAFYHVVGLASEMPKANEGQEWRWVPVAELASLQFPEANQPVVDALQSMTDEARMRLSALTA